MISANQGKPALTQSQSEIDPYGTAHFYGLTLAFAVDLRESREAGIMEGRTAGKIEGRIEGKLEGKIELIIKKYKKGCTAEETADMLEEPPSQIRQIYDAIGQCAPDYNVEKIYKRLSDQTV